MVKIIKDTLSCYVYTLKGEFVQDRTKYGYDSMDPANLDDDHISVKEGDYTFVAFDGFLSDIKNYYFKVDSTKIWIELMNLYGGDILKITALPGITQDTTKIRVATTSLKKQFLREITVCIYKEKVFPKGKYFIVSQKGTNSTLSLNNTDILNGVNTLFKPIVARLEGLDQPIELKVDFDKNKNGILDFYSAGANSEIDAIFGAAKAKGANFSSMFFYTSIIQKRWRIAKTIQQGDTEIEIIGTPRTLTNNQTYKISLPDGTLDESFKIISTMGNRLTIDTDPNTPGNQGFSMTHPKTADDITSHVISQRDQETSGLAADEKLKNPKIVSAPTVDKAAHTFAHELMHDAKLLDILYPGNVMHWLRMSVSNDKAFLFQLLDVVITGTDTKTGNKQNQWHSINRKK